MSSLDQKILALLASTTIEGEALAAWRQLRKKKPEGDLFSPSGQPHSPLAFAKARQAAYDRGYTAGVAARRAAMSLSEREKILAECQKEVKAAVKRHKAKLDAEHQKVLGKLLRESSLWRRGMHLFLDLAGAVITSIRRFGFLVIAAFVLSQIGGLS